MLDAEEIDKIVNNLKEEIEDGTVNAADYTFKALLPIIEQQKKAIVILEIEKGELQKEITKSKRQNRRLEDQLTLSQRPRIN
ncbi:MAG: hypothetical protein WC422_00550 [Candidatus Paceibacterota bacterium]